MCLCAFFIPIKDCLITYLLDADHIGLCVCGAGVLKEFLREMPEPLSSDSLYQMLMDALNVQISGDADGNARLMLGVLDCLPAVNQVSLSPRSNKQDCQILRKVKSVRGSCRGMLRYIYSNDVTSALANSYRLSLAAAK